MKTFRKYSALILLALAAILCAVSNPHLRAAAADSNRSIIQHRAEKSVVSAAVAAFYRQLSGK